jgi:hypothetical protein
MTRAMPWILASNMGRQLDPPPGWGIKLSGGGQALGGGGHFARWGIKLSGGGHALGGGGHYAHLSDTEVQQELFLPLAHLR